MSIDKSKKAEYADLRRAVYNRFRDEHPEIFLPIYVEEAQNRGISPTTMKGALGVVLKLKEKLKQMEGTDNAVRS